MSGFSGKWYLWDSMQLLELAFQSSDMKADVRNCTLLLKFSIRLKPVAEWKMVAAFHINFVLKQGFVWDTASDAPL